MPQTPSSSFAIHVDGSCVTDSTDLKKPCKRSDSDQTTIHHELESDYSDQDGSTTDRLRRENNDTHSDYESSYLNTQNESQLDSNISTDSQTEALIRKAARAVVARIEEDHYEHEDSVLSSRTEEGYDGGTELTYDEGSALTYGKSTEMSYDSDTDHNVEDRDHDHDHDPYDGSASSHHEDDVFSHGNRNSNRSSLNSITDEDVHQKSKEYEEPEHERLEISEGGEETRSTVSRTPSQVSTTYSLLPEPLTISSLPKPHTPSKILSRPPFRTPSSVRAIQMSSPTPSLFSSPRSSKRPTVSRLGTPQAQAPSPSKTKTPTRFKVKKEYPLVLLHVTVLPLHWVYADAMDSMTGEGLPMEMHGIRESWKLLKEKLGDTVLERGILLPHPQDSYEVLEERLLEALELPVRPRAKILSCGHYLGPDESELSSAEESDNDDVFRVSKQEKWCDICGREVRYEDFGIGEKEKRFRVKVYASNGLMRAGAWAAAWREMERVDVEIEPFVQSHLAQLMGSLAAAHVQLPPPEIFDIPHHDDHDETTQKQLEEEVERRRQELEEERMREVYGTESRPASKMSKRSSRRQEHYQSQYGNSLPELIFAAIKVAMKDRRNIVIVVLSAIVLFLAIRPSSSVRPIIHDGLSNMSSVGQDFGTSLTDLGKDVEASGKERLAELPIQVTDIVKTFTSGGPEIAREPTISVQNVASSASNTAQEIASAAKPSETRIGQEKVINAESSIAERTPGETTYIPPLGAQAAHEESMGSEMPMFETVTDPTDRDKLERFELEKIIELSKQEQKEEVNK